MLNGRTSFLTLAVAAAVAGALCLAGPGFAKGAGGGAGGGGSKAPAAKAPPAKAKTVLDMIEGDTSLAKFAAAIKGAGLEETLKGAGPFTVLAPSDAAFGKLDAAKWADLAKPENKAKLKGILEGHIVTSKMMLADIAKATKLSATGGASHDVKLGDDKAPVIDGVAKITKSDIAGSNGLVQIIDTVLMPAEKK